MPVDCTVAPVDMAAVITGDEFLSPKRLRAGDVSEFIAEGSDVDYINDYLTEMHPGAGLHCQVMEGKGRTLISHRTYGIGDVIFVEAPLHIVCEDDSDCDYEKIKGLCEDDGDMDYEALWYWCAVRSLTDRDLPSSSSIPSVSSETQKRLLLLHKPEITEVSESVRRVVQACGLEGCDQLLEELLQIWIHNCFEYQETPTGYSTYFAPAFMSHSCLPNAGWVNDPEGNFVLKARLPIERGDEVCVSYLSEEALLDCTRARVDDLNTTKGFVCTCPRCTAEEDPSRVFACPSCSVGDVVFPSDAPLLSDGKEAIDAFNRLPVCLRCGKELSAERFFLYLKSEGRLAAVLKGLESKDITRHNAGEFMDAGQAKQLRKLSKAVTNDHHGTAAKVLHILADYYIYVKEFSEAIKCLDIYLDFCVRAYDGLNGAHSWALEEKADILLEQATYQVLAQRNPTRFASLSSQATRRMFFYGSFSAKEIEQLSSCGILETYQKAAEELKLLFGFWHEYHTKVNEKIIKVQRRLTSL